MRRKFLVGIALAAAVSGGLQMLPSGASQHYTAVLKQAASAAGALAGGGKGDASFSQGSGIASGSPTSTSIGIPAAFPIPEFVSFFKGCVNLFDGSGDLVDTGCVDKAQPGNMVDILLQSGSIKLVVPSDFYAGGTLSAIIMLRGKGPIMPNIDPDLILDLSDPDILLGLDLIASREAVAIGTITSSTFPGLGGALMRGTGELSRSLNALAFSCEGPCGTPPSPTPTPSPSPTDTGGGD